MGRCSNSATRRASVRAQRAALAAALAAGLAGALAGCGTDAGSAGVSPTGKLAVTAAENFWGDIAAQLGGDKVDVANILADPNTDPHSYEPTAADGVPIA